MTNSRSKQPSVALVYDHVTTANGGAELVLQILMHTFPDAPLFTSVYDDQQATWASHTRVKPSFLQSLGPLKRFHQLLAPLHPLAIESLDVSSFDIIVSVSAGTAKGILTSPKQLHVCYLLTPPRYLNQHNTRDAYVQSFSVFKLPGVNIIARPWFRYLRQWDQVAAWRPDKVIAISKLVSERIQNSYHREVDAIIYPPFTTESVSAPTSTNFFLSLGRLVNYKCVDVSIQACLRTQHTLVIAGVGRERSALINQASDQAYIRKNNQSATETMTAARERNKSIIFLNSCSDSEKNWLLANAQALLIPGEEDFGLTGLEAAHHGTPTITYHGSGIAEILTAPDLGVHLSDHRVSTLIHAITTYNKADFPAEKLRARSEQYTAAKFSSSMRNTIYQFWQQHSTISA